MKKIVIVGGVAGGASAAARLRRLDRDAQIVVFERSGFVSYANCGLPYYVGGVIKEKSALTLQTPESFWKRFKVDMRVKHNVLKIDAEKKTVTVENLLNGKVYDESYDSLILSPGAKPSVPNLPGVDSDKIYLLRTVEDSLRLREKVIEEGVKSAVVAGGGFIGIETAENLRDLGLEVTMVQRPKQLLKPIDPDMASFVHNEMRDKGVKLRLGSAVAGFEERNGKIVTFIKDEQELVSDLVILAIGVSPETSLAKDAGLELGVKGSIVVDEHMRTSKSDIYAVGDAVQVKHFVSGLDTNIPLAGPANKQGRIAADNICGIESSYKGSQGSSIVKVFDLTAAATGLNSAQAKEAGYDFESVIIAPASHAGYYPGGKQMSLKMLYDRVSGKILGAQIVGYEGVDKRIDVLATAIRAGMKATDLTELELAYAPPYSSAKDPVNFAGYVAENIEQGLLKQVQWTELPELPKDGSAIYLDCRNPAELENGSIEGFINIPLDSLRDRLGELDKSKPVYVTCQVGLRGYLACRILMQNGYDCYNFPGGYRYYASLMKDEKMAESLWPCGLPRN